MIYSRSAEYAIRAFVYLASVPDAKYAMAKQIAAESDIPAHFLAKILQQLARKGFLRSSKGPTGGFCLRKPASEIALIDLVDAVDGLSDYQRCISGLAECNDAAPCGLHDSWIALKSRIIEYLEGTSIADVSESRLVKLRLLERSRKPRRVSRRG
jgi:Rrf2 family protein